MPSDIEIAQAAKLQRISAVAREKLGIAEEHLEHHVPPALRHLPHGFEATSRDRGWATAESY